MSHMVGCQTPSSFIGEVFVAGPQQNHATQRGNARLALGSPYVF